MRSARWTASVHLKPRLVSLLRSLLTPGFDTRGQEMIEYALLAGFIVVSVAAFVPYQVTAPISTVFGKVLNYLNSVGGA